MTKSTLQLRALRAANTFKSLGFTQQDVADAIGVSQSQVCRVLAGGAVRQSSIFDAVCIYAESMFEGISLDVVRGDDELIQALADTWDGSPSHSRALAAVIRSLGVLRPGRTTDPPA